MYTTNPLILLFGSLLAATTCLSAPTAITGIETMGERSLEPRDTKYFKLCTGKNFVDCYDAPSTNARCTNVPTGLNDRINSLKATGPYNICYIYVDNDCNGGLRGGPVTNDDRHADLSTFGSTWVNSVSSYVCV
ncbi:hypothetical protein F5Y18DRAFT_440369 [Xylariaceae sp. FL1019]|nr:hypothetical protein F5Y18DRAFT_440369 [Xylariaceae sp. FL1019]